MRAWAKLVGNVLRVNIKILEPIWTLKNKDRKQLKFFQAVQNPSGKSQAASWGCPNPLLQFGHAGGGTPRFATPPSLPHLVNLFPCYFVSHFQKQSSLDGSSWSHLGPILSYLRAAPRGDPCKRPCLGSCSGKLLGHVEVLK